MTAKKVTRRPRRKGESVAVDTEWFMAKIKAAGLSQRKVAKLMRVDVSSFHNTINGRRKMATSEAVELAELIGVSVQDVLHHIGIELPTGSGKREIRLAGWVDSDGTAEITWSGSGELIDGPPDVPGGTVAVQVRGSTMIDGCLLYLQGPPHGVSPEAIGRLSLCRVRGGKHLIRYVKRGYKRGTHTLTADGSPIMADADLEFATPISWIRVA